MALIRQPVLTPVPFRNLWSNEFDFEITVRGHKIVVPFSFLTDGANIPRYLWSISYHPFDPKIILAALIHDWLYWNHQVSREEADLIFLELLILNGADYTLAQLMYKAVSGFGNSSYWENDDEDRILLYLLYLNIKESPIFTEYHFPMEEIT